MKKKLLALTLMAALLLSACGTKKDQEAGNVADPAQSESQTEENAESSEEESQEAAPADYTKGTSDEKGFESEWIGVKFTAPEGAVMSTEEEINTMMGLSQELLSDDYNEAQLKYAELTSVTEMMCSYPEGTPNVNITVEKLNVSGASVEDYIAAVEQQLTGLTAITYTVVSNDKTRQIGGQEYVELLAVADYNGVSMYQGYYARMIGDRAVSIIVTYTDENEEQANAMLDAFVAY